MWYGIIKINNSGFKSSLLFVAHFYVELKFKSDNLILAEKSF